MKRIVLLLILAVVTSTGCQSTTMTSMMAKMPWKKTAEVEPEAVDEIELGRTGTPMSMACVWKDGTMGAAGKSVRGLAGRVYFHDSNQRPIKVDGNFTVYAYVSDGTTGPRKVQPDRKFVFDSENLERHYSESDIGDSYSFWLPWDSIDGNETTLNLLPILKTSDGRIVRGEEVVAFLPGKKLNQIESSIQELQEEVERNRHRQVLYQSEGFNAHVQRQQSLRTNTIQVPSEASSIQQVLSQPRVGQPSQTDRIAATAPTETAAAPANANIAATDEGRLGIAASSEEAWEQALDAFRMRGATQNRRLAPQSMNLR